VLFGINDGDDKVDDVTRCSKLAGLTLGPKHREQIIEGVAQALGMVVFDL
jgi:hypothetical protein